MKRKLTIIFSAVFLLIKPLSAEAFDASALTNKISQNKNLADTFFYTFSSFVNELAYPIGRDSSDSFFKIRTSLDAVYYTGFEINTDFGSQEGSLVQGYSDLLLGRKGKNITFAFGTAGSRYGVFLTDINFNIPSGDPVSSVRVNDFTGTQIMTDIFSGLIGIKNIAWLGGYFFTSSNYSPDDTGILSFKKKNSSIDYWGIKGNISTVLNYDVLLTKNFKVQSVNWSFDFLRTTLLLLRKPLHYDDTLKAGMYWYKTKEIIELLSKVSQINWKSFDIPINFSHTFDTFFTSIVLDGGITFSVEDMFTGLNVTEAYGGISASHLFSMNGQYRLGIVLQGSYYSNENLALFGNTNSSNVFGIEAGLTISPGISETLLITGSWRYNYIEDLKNLIESKDKQVYSIYATINY